MKTACKTKKPVIPAQAGIQTIIKPHEVGQDLIYGFVRYAELYDKLDSGLRRNDGCHICLCHELNYPVAYLTESLPASQPSLEASPIGKVYTPALRMTTSSMPKNIGDFLSLLRFALQAPSCCRGSLRAPEEINLGTGNLPLNCLENSSHATLKQQAASHDQVAP